ncbi:uncharacterized protein LOC119769575 [Culex quinquefasciatus]|uniref:uncharacterized protein LOC119769575 n=1 Tax=Culex quinquefasciatus TaxID=7176 RepID=UPI0018E2CD20|nr:uncharacterized protein LOC119769575 [Culex quinquefasciatus]
MIDSPETPPNMPPLSYSATYPDGPSSPPLRDAELVDLSGIFCEVMHEIRLDLLPTPEFVQMQQHMFNTIQHKAAAHDMENGSDEHLQMFNKTSRTQPCRSASAESTLSEKVARDVQTEESLLVAADSSRVTIYNYESTAAPTSRLPYRKWRPGH